MHSVSCSPTTPFGYATVHGLIDLINNIKSWPLALSYNVLSLMLKIGMTNQNRRVIFKLYNYQTIVINNEEKENARNIEGTMQRLKRSFKTGV